MMLDLFGKRCSQCKTGTAVGSVRTTSGYKRVCKKCRSAMGVKKQPNVLKHAADKQAREDTKRKL